MPWILYDVLAAATYNVIDSSKAVVACDLMKLNDAKVMCASPAPIDVDREVKIIDQVLNPETKVVIEEHTILHGRIQKYGQMTKGVTNNTYEYTVKELAVELEKFRIHTGTNYTVNCSTQNTSLYAATALQDSGWVKGTGADQTIQALQFRYMTAIAGLNKLISELTAASAATPLYMWFDSASKNVSWGEYRNDRTSLNFTKGIYYNYKEEKTIRNQVAGVVIYGANSAYSGYYPNPLPGSEYNLAVYQYDDATSNSECAEIAKAVYLTWCADPKRRIQFVLRPADTKVSGQYILEGDRIQVDGLNYTVIDMTYSPKEVLIGVNAGEDSVLYSLGDKLRPVAGTATGASEIVWSPGTQNVSSDGSTVAKFILEISSLGDVSTTIPMNVEIGPYKIYGYPEVTGVTNAMLDQVRVPAGFNGGQMVWSIKDGETWYLPFGPVGNWIETNVLQNGYAYALANICGTIYNGNLGASDEGVVYISACYSWDNVQWFESSHQSMVYLFPAFEVDGTTISQKGPFSVTCIIPGAAVTTKLYLKWKFVADLTGTAGIAFDIRYVTAMMDVMLRHSHTLQQSGQAPNTILPNQEDNVTESEVTPPGSVTCQINSGTPFSVSNNTPIDISTGHGLASGRNEIKFTSTTVCTVTPSATYQMYGA